MNSTNFLKRIGTFVTGSFGFNKRLSNVDKNNLRFELDNTVQDLRESITAKKFVRQNQYRFDKYIIFRPNDNFKSKWDLVIMFGALFNCYFVPLNVAFDDQSLDSIPFLILNSIIDFIFLMDIIISFRTVFIDEKGDECGEGRLMAQNYLKTTFIIDVLATVPFDTFLSISD